MEIGLVHLFDGSPEQGPEYMAEFARTAERYGFAGIWVPEHIVFFNHYESAYPYPNHPTADDPNKLESHHAVVDGKPQVEAAERQGLLDVQLTAAALLGATQKLRVGSSVALLPLRNVRVLTRELWSLAEMTGGRFDLGIGVGWSTEEVDACEADPKTRGKRTSDSTRDLFDLWDADIIGRPAGSWAAPRVLVAGHSPAAIRRAAEVGTGWYPYNLTMDEWTEHHTAYVNLLKENGRGRADQHAVAGVRFTGEDLSAVRKFVDGYTSRGADAVNISLRLTPDTYADTMAELADVLGLVA
jgi:alkanesulfonate monooxygenase SsuD/methylene tetrahydromethanopterin reductase-like flavin-dependent oxidoreductase (luciferase family)